MQGREWIKFTLFVIVVLTIFVCLTSSTKSPPKETPKPKAKSVTPSTFPGKKPTTDKKSNPEAKPKKSPKKDVKDVFELITPKHPVVNLDHDRYVKFFKLPLTQQDLAQIDLPRRTYASLMFFTGSRAQCQICHLLERTYKQVAKLYYDQYLNPSTSFSSSELKLVFSSIDPKRAPAAFKDFQVQNLPVIVLIPPFAGTYGAKGSFEPKTFPFRTMHDITHPSSLVSWIRSQSFQIVESKNPDDQISIHIPVPIYENETFITASFVIVILLVLCQIPFLIRNLFHPWLWFCIGMVVFSFGFGGTVYNSMREGPAYQDNQDGTIQLFSSGLRTQYRAEGYVMAFAMMILSGMWVFLTIGLRKIGSGVLRWMVFLVLVGAMVVMLLWGVNVFSHHKMPGYPYDTRWPRA